MAAFSWVPWYGLFKTNGIILFNHSQQTKPITVFHIFFKVPHSLILSNYGKLHTFFKVADIKHIGQLAQYISYLLRSLGSSIS